MTITYIGVGSNTGDRVGNVHRSISLLEKGQEGISVKRESFLYETEALCQPGQRMPPFINGVVEVETDSLPLVLLDQLEAIERGMGRYHKGNWKPRSIDLDILLYGGEIVHLPRLTIPHPEIPKRWFVLRPLADLIPDFVHPILGKTLLGMLKDLEDRKGVGGKKWEK